MDDLGGPPLFLVQHPYSENPIKTLQSQSRHHPIRLPVLPEVVSLFFPRILDRTCTILSLHPPAITEDFGHTSHLISVTKFYTRFKHIDLSPPTWFCSKYQIISTFWYFHPRLYLAQLSSTSRYKLNVWRSFWPSCLFEGNLQLNCPRPCLSDSSHEKHPRFPPSPRSSGRGTAHWRLGPSTSSQVKWKVGSVDESLDGRNTDERYTPWN